MMGPTLKISDSSSKPFFLYGLYFVSRETVIDTSLEALLSDTWTEAVRSSFPSLLDSIMFVDVC